MVNKQYTNRSEHGQRQSIKIVKNSKKTGQVPQKFRKFHETSAGASCQIYHTLDPWMKPYQ